MADRTCYACGTPAPAGAQFCRQCGRDLDPEEPEGAEIPVVEESAPEPRSRRLLIACILGALLIAGVILAVVLSQKSDKKPATRAATTTVKTPPVDPDIALNKKAVIDLDAALRLAKMGRTALAAKNLKLATKNRAQVVVLLGAIKAPPGKVADAIVPLKAAFVFALKLDRTCGLSCPAASNKQAQKLKQTALDAVNPLLMAGPGTHYAVTDI